MFLFFTFPARNLPLELHHLACMPFRVFVPCASQLCAAFFLLNAPPDVLLPLLTRPLIDGGGVCPRLTLPFGPHAAPSRSAMRDGQHPGDEYSGQ
jgi:hypothetical protein